MTHWGLNAHVANFMKTLKIEEVFLHPYRTMAERMSRLPTYLEAVYNSTRLHSALGHVPPNEFEMQHHPTLAEVK